MMQQIINSMMALLITTALSVGMLVALTPQIANAIPCTDVTPPACDACEGAGGVWNGKGCDPKTGASVPDLTGTDDSIFEQVINVLTFIVGAVSVIMLIIGGLRYVLSNGDANAITSAKNTIIYALVGIVVAFAARAIVFFVLDQLSG